MVVAVAALVGPIVWLGPEDPLFSFGLPQGVGVRLATRLGGSHDIDWLTSHALGEGVVVTLDGSSGFHPRSCLHVVQEPASKRW